MFFSVIIPCYNSWKFMARGIQSLENQTFKDFEVIFIDDCSTDDTHSHLLQYQAATSLTVKILKNEKNSGPGESRNYGIRNSFGRYITFLDSDDWYETDFLQQMHTQIENTQADIVFCDYTLCLDNGRKIYNNQGTAAYRQTLDKAHHIACCYGSLCCAAIRSELFTKIQLPNLYNCEDSVTVPLLLYHSDVVSCVPKYLYNYFCRAASLSSSSSPKVVEQFLQAYHYLTSVFPKGYEEEIEFRGIRIIVYGATVKAIQAKMPTAQIKDIQKEFSESNRNWHKNKYIKYLPLRKRVFISFVRYRLWFLCKLYLLAQSYIFNKK